MFPKVRDDRKNDYLLQSHTIFYGLLVMSFLILVLAAIRFFSVEVDEANYLLSIGQLAGGPLAENGVLEARVWSMGGLFAAMHYPLMLANAPIEIHRLASFLFLGLSLALVYGIVRAQGVNRWMGLAAAVAFTTAPGLLLQAGFSMAEMMSTFLILGGAWYWTERGGETTRGSVLTGLVLGLACATRVTAVTVLPAILVWGDLYARKTPGVRRNSRIACLVAVAAFLLCAALYKLLFNPAQVNWTSSVTLVPRHVPTLSFGEFWLSQFMRSEMLFPMAALAVCSAAVAIGFPAGALATLRPFCVLLTLIGLIGWVGWIVVAPIPHVRYLYPAVAALWLAGTLLVTGWLTTLEPGRPRLLLQVVIVAVFAAQFVDSFRQVMYGESLGIIYEPVGFTPIKVFFKAFRARQDQAEFASLLTALRESGICVLQKGWNYPFYFLTMGKISLAPLFDAANRKSGQCLYLALIPEDQDIWATSNAARWINDNAKLQARVGDYLLYKIAPGAPDLEPSTELQQF